MRKHQHLYLCIGLLIQSVFSQNTKVLRGIILDADSAPIEQVHIYNETTKKGTISNKKGQFSISVNERDWLHISNIQYISKKIKVKKGNLREGFLRVHLIPENHLLEEAVITTKLKRRLTLDVLKPKKDSIREQMTQLIKTINSIAHKKIMNMPIGADEQLLKKPNNAQLLTDPIAKNTGATLKKQDLLTLI